MQSSSSRKVRVHWNIHKGGLVLRNYPNIVGDMEYVNSVCIKDAIFVVREKTRDRIRKGEDRSVHAWVEGELCNCGELEGEDVTYNPYRDNGFVVRGTDKVLKTAKHVSLRAHGTGKTAKHETRVKL